jgi:hypothetical protein
MLNRKLIVGILAILVILTTVQGFRPVIAGEGNSSDSGSSNGSYGNTLTITDGSISHMYTVSIGVEKGQGMVCWSGASTGCTQSIGVVWLNPGETITVTAKGADGYNFASWDKTNLSSEGASSVYIVFPTNSALSPDSLTMYASILANFTPA